MLIYISSYRFPAFRCSSWKNINCFNQNLDHFCCPLRSISLAVCTRTVFRS
ncbi:unnamed protein product [Schistosoma curassoni]|uniref:Uncharacterized protein n=1 Tax=Schistosoma curassoni TaxID=6186 RepID=A0A183JFG5_9TREM|nr:unnamed protein product [Schistosoma curassoni]